MKLLSLPKKIAIVFIIVALAFIQIILFLLIKNKLLFLNSNFLIYDNSVYHGVMFFSDGPSDQYTCDLTYMKHLFSILRIVFKRYDSYLYFINEPVASAQKEQITLNFDISILNEVKVSAINFTENALHNICQNSLLNRELFISANHDNTEVSPFKIISLPMANKKQKKSEFNTFITGVSSRFSCNNPSDLEIFHLYIEETEKKLINSLDKLNEKATLSNFKILLFDCDYLLLDKIINKTKIDFDLIICSNLNMGKNKIKKGDSIVIFCDHLDKSIIKLDIYSKKQKIFFRITKIPLYRRLLSPNEKFLSLNNNQ